MNKSHLCSVGPGWAFLAIAMLLVPTARCLHAQVIFQNDFDAQTPGLYTEQNLEDQWNQPTFDDGVREGRVSIVSGNEAFGGNGASMAVSYPAGQDGTKETGAQWILKLDGEYEEATLRYRVKFRQGFDFVRGGKLPGLAGGTAPTGSTQSDGINGWTGRLMWRTDFDGVSGQPAQLTSNAISYAKYATSGFAGDGEQEDKLYFTEADDSRVVWQSGVWYEITQYVKMNTPGQSDGIIRVFVDGRQVYDQTDALIRHAASLKIDKMYFSTFFGGNEDWRTSKDEVAYFDDFEISVPEIPEPPAKPIYLKVPSAYPTVQSAIDAARDIDIVAIRGHHHENIMINKPILVRGYTGTRLTAVDENLPCITVNCSGATVKRIWATGGLYGVEVVSGSTDVLLTSMDVRGAHAGIVVNEGCDRIRIVKCDSKWNDTVGISIEGSTSPSISSSESLFNGGVGLEVIDSDDASMIKNRVGNNSGIGVLVDAGNAFMANNLSYLNGGEGFLVRQDNHTFLLNEARRNVSDGVAFEASFGNDVTRNQSRVNEGNGFYWGPLTAGSTADENWGRVNDGLDFLDHGDNSVSGNRSSDGTGR